MEISKQNIIDFLKKKIDYLDDLVDTNIVRETLNKQEKTKIKAQF